MADVRVGNVRVTACGNVRRPVFYFVIDISHI